MTDPGKPAHERAQELEALLRDLYARCRAEGNTGPYIADHDNPAFIAGQVQSFLWYRPLLAEAGKVLDWGCRHAPDACMIRHAIGPQLELYGCDLENAKRFAAFHSFAGLEYTKLTHPSRLPYEDDAFDAIVGAGALEHTARDIDCLQELWRCLKPKGLLVLTYLPNRWSYQEFLRRRRGRAAHLRLYSRCELQTILSHAGFIPQEMGYQTRFDALARVAPSAFALRWPVRMLQLHRITSCLCVAARKVTSM